MGQDCKYCGAYIAGQEDKCPACGKRVKKESGSAYAAAKAEDKEERWAPEREAKEESRTYTYTYKDEYEKRYGSQTEKPAYMPGDNHPGAGNGEMHDIRQNRALCYLCYFGPLFLNPYLLKRDSDFVKFHSNQGLLLLLANIVLNFVGEIVPFIGWLISLIGGIFVFVCFIKGLMNVYHGEKKALPVIGEIALLK